MADNTSNRGFASMDEEKQKDIASKGGQASQSGQDNNQGNFANDPEKASEAGKKGGQKSQRKDDEDEEEE